MKEIGMSNKSIMLGAVAYTAKVVDIWEGIKEFFIRSSCPLDFVLFSNYEAQIEALLGGFIDIAWNTNLAFVKTDLRLDGKTKLLAMRDTDIGFTSKLIARKNTLSSIQDLRGKTLALGSRDSAQAALMPEFYLQSQDLHADRDYKCIRFNSDVGKHGDTGRSELEVIAAVRSGKADLGAVGVSTWQGLAANEPDLCEIWTSPGYSHCVFNALPEADEKLCRHFVDTLMKMDYGKTEDRILLELEGLKKWVDASRDGYADIFKAAKVLNYASESKLVSGSC